MDDIQIHACTTKEELETQTKQVLGRLRKHDPYFKLEYILKMQITTKEVDLLSTTITKDEYDKLATELGIAQLLRP